MEQKPGDVGGFFNEVAGQYDATIERCFPRYREMLWAVVDYLPPNRNCNSILELGCGTGNLSAMVHHRFPDAAMTVVDLSGDSLEVCRSQLAGCKQLNCIEADFSKLHFEPESFDLVVSSIAIHHVDAATKQALFHQIFQWLTADGVLCYADQCAGETEDLYRRHIDNWKTISFAAGTDDAEWAMWMKHQLECDFHETLRDQIQWLQQAGFPVIDCPWRYLLWSVIQARK